MKNANIKCIYINSICGKIQVPEVFLTKMFALKIFISKILVLKVLMLKIFIWKMLTLIMLMQLSAQKCTCNLYKF